MTVALNSLRSLFLLSHPLPPLILSEVPEDFDLNVMLLHQLYSKAGAAYKKAYHTEEWKEWKAFYENFDGSMGEKRYKLHALKKKLDNTQAYREWVRLDRAYLDFKFAHRLTGMHLTWYGFNKELTD